MNTSKKIILNICPMNQRYQTITVTPDHCIKDCKEQYYEIVNNREESIWRFEGKLLKDDDKVGDLGLEDQDEIVVIRRNKGGNN